MSLKSNITFREFNSINNFGEATSIMLSPSAPWRFTAGHSRWLKLNLLQLYSVNIGLGSSPQPDAVWTCWLYTVFGPSGYVTVVDVTVGISTWYSRIKMVACQLLEIKDGLAAAQFAQKSK